MNDLQIGIARAYGFYEDWLKEHGTENPDAAAIQEEMVCLQYRYEGLDPAEDPERRHIPPPPPPPPPPF